MARKNQEEEVKTWKPTTKFFAVKSLYRFQIKEGVYQNTEKGTITIVPPEFLTINNTDGYTPKTEEEEKRLIALSEKAGSYVIEYSKIPKSADAKRLESDLIATRREKEELAAAYEELKVLAKLNGIEVP